MSSVVDLILLASSSKNHERCIAGIDCKTGEWIRPVGLYGKGEVPFKLRNIDGKEPEILDIIRMELEETAETYGFQKENRTIVNTPWKFISKAKVVDILPFCCKEENIFFNSSSEVRYKGLLEDATMHKSLQLWEVKDFRCEVNIGYNGNRRWKGRFTTPRGDDLSLIIKDISFEDKLNKDENHSNHCLLLISLGTPFLSKYRSEEYCWKLIATVIELYQEDVT